MNTIRAVQQILLLLNSRSAILKVSALSVIAGASEFRSVASVVWALDKYSSGTIAGKYCISDFCVDLTISPKYFVLLIVSMVIFAYTTRILNTVYIQKSSLSIGRAVSLTILNNLIERDLFTFQIHSNAEYSNIMIVKTGLLVRNILVPLFSLLSSLVYSAILILISSASNAEFTAYIITTIFISYFIIYITLRQKLKIISQSISKTADDVMTETYSILKRFVEVKLASNRQTHTHILQQSLSKQNKSLNTAYAIQASPKLILEAAAIISVLIYFSNNFTLNNTLLELAPTLMSLYILQKLLPQGQLIFNAFAQLRSNSAVVADILKLLQYETAKRTKPINLEDHFRITFRNVEGNSLDNKNLITLNNANLEAGDLITIKGASGAGKSTLINAILGILPYQRGEVLINNIKYPFTHNLFRGCVSILNQDISFGTTEYQIFREYRDASPANLLRVTDLIDKLNLGSLRFLLENNSFVKYEQLSGGQLQRVKLLYKICENNPILICDEPTSALDQDNKYRVSEVLKSYSENNLVLIVTHDPVFDSVASKVINVASKHASVD